MVGSCEHGNEPSVLMKCGEFDSAWNRLRLYALPAVESVSCFVM